MKWTNEKILELIEAYKQRTPLWKVSDVYYKHKCKKENAWHELARLMGTDVMEVKKKIQALLASFRRERRKCKSAKGVIYEPNWFAYRSLLFLAERNGSRNSQDSEGNEGHEDFEVGEEWGNYVETVIEEDPLPDPSIYHSPQRCQTPPELIQIPPSEEFVAQKINTKRKAEDSSRVVDGYIMKSVPDHSRDDCSIYSEHVACKLRSYDTFTRAIVQHHINNAIFNADMGTYSRMKYKRLAATSDNPALALEDGELRSSSHGFSDSECYGQLEEIVTPSSYKTC